MVLLPGDLGHRRVAEETDTKQRQAYLGAPLDPRPQRGTSQEYRELLPGVYPLSAFPCFSLNLSGRDRPDRLSLAVGPRRPTPTAAWERHLPLPLSLGTITIHPLHLETPHGSFYGSMARGRHTPAAHLHKLQVGQSAHRVVGDVGLQEGVELVIAAPQRGWDGVHAVTSAQRV